MATSNFLRDFIDNELYPVIFEKLDEVFEDMHFERFKGDWRSSAKIDGSVSATDKDEAKVRGKNPRYIFFQTEQKPKDILDYYIEKYNIPDFYTAIKKLSDKFGLVMPKGEMSDEIKKVYKERAEKKSLQNKLVESLFSKEGERGLLYLTEERKFTVEQIKEAGFGWVTQEIKNEYGLLCYNKISIPIQSNNVIISYQYRKIDEAENAPKYINETKFITGKILANLSKVELKADTKGIVIVEGMMDAISAKIKGGLKNVVCSGGWALTDAQINQIISCKAKSVYFLIDNDEAGKNGINIVAEKLEDKHLTVYVCTLPEGYKDTDDFLRNPQNTPEMLQNIIERGEIFPYYKLNNLLSKCSEISTSGRQSEAIEIYISGVYDILDRCDAVHYEMILNSAFDFIGDSKESFRQALKKESEKRIAVKKNEDNRTALNKIISKAQNDCNFGNPDLIIEEIESGIKEIKKNQTSDLGNKYLNPRSTEERIKSYSTKAGGVPTVFYFGTNSNNREQLYLPSDALTLIGGKSSHGKSRLMINLAMQMAYENAISNKQGRILYFCFEENQDTVEQKFLNNFCGIQLNSNGNLNGKCIADYYKPQNEKTWFIAKEKFEHFQQKEKEFYQYFIDCGRLQIINDSRDVFDIIKIIRCLHDKINGGIHAVFIDYIQLLNIDGFRGERYAELKVIIESLNSLANTERIPIIFGSQLKNTVDSIGKFEIENASDASDLGKSTDTAIFIWDSKKGCVSSNEWGNDTPRKIEIEKAGFIPGITENSLYMQIVKSRNGVRDSYCIAQLDPQFWRVMPSQYWGRGNSKQSVYMYEKEIDFSEITNRYKQNDNF